jgi:hypothetical protein
VDWACVGFEHNATAEGNEVLVTGVQR